MATWIEQSLKRVGSISIIVGLSTMTIVPELISCAGIDESGQGKIIAKGKSKFFTK